jgi:hypothetical protein
MNWIELFWKTLAIIGITASVSFQAGIGTISCKDDTTKGIEQRIKECPVIEKDKINFKNSEIVRIVKNIPRQNIKFSRVNYDIEITEIQTTKNGLEVFARAWQSDGTQIGFGKDGSVDIERFIFINPPILVNDINGTIVREWTDLKGNLRQDKLREDPKEAILQSLAHTIKVKKEKFGNAKIIQGKKGSTTLTAYPAAGANSPVDGRTTVGSISASGTWTFMQGTSTSETINVVTPTIYSFIRSSAGPSGDYNLFERIHTLFDTSSIGSGSTISSATLSYYDASDKQNDFSMSVNIYSTNPASNNNLVIQDYSTQGTTAFSSNLAQSSITDNAYNDFVLNSSGITAINMTGISKFAYRYTKDADNSPPTWAANKSNYWAVFSADTAGTTNDPKLVVEYTGVAVSAPKDDSEIIWFQ